MRSTRAARIALSGCSLPEKAALAPTVASAWNLVVRIGVARREPGIRHALELQQRARGGRCDDSDLRAQRGELRGRHADAEVHAPILDPRRIDGGVRCNTRLASAQVELRTPRDRRLAARRAIHRAQAKRHLQLLDDTARDLVLDGEDVVQVAIEALAPELEIRPARS